TFGWVNGTIATVVSIHMNSVVIRDVENRNRTKVIKRVTEDISPPGKPESAQRSQFPLDLAYALTIHKAQGLTLKRVYVDLSHIWESGQAYVAISRIEDPSQLKIMNYNKNKIMLHPYYKAVLEWIYNHSQIGEYSGNIKRFSMPAPNPPKFFGEKGDENINYYPDSDDESDPCADSDSEISEPEIDLEPLQIKSPVKPRLSVPVHEEIPAEDTSFTVRQIDVNEPSQEEFNAVVAYMQRLNTPISKLEIECMYFLDEIRTIFLDGNLTDPLMFRDFCRAKMNEQRIIDLHKR
ncbi:ATP-dependent DNA helicase pif1-like protein, partial [Leptotrombidium deliense]